MNINKNKFQNVCHYLLPYVVCWFVYSLSSEAVFVTDNGRLLVVKTVNPFCGNLSSLVMVLMHVKRANDYYVSRVLRYFSNSRCARDKHIIDYDDVIIHGTRKLRQRLFF
jgi:hypothetical protein